MQILEEKTGCRRHLCTCTRAYGELEEIRYVLWEESGESRAAFDTPCARFYSLAVHSADGECYLVDIAREEKEAYAIFLRFAMHGVLPTNADEVFEDYCLT